MQYWTAQHGTEGTKWQQRSNQSPQTTIERAFISDRNPLVPPSWKQRGYFEVCPPADSLGNNKGVARRMFTSWDLQEFYVNFCCPVGPQEWENTVFSDNNCNLNLNRVLFNHAWVSLTSQIKESSHNFEIRYCITLKPITQKSFHLQKFLNRGRPSASFLWY